jgi:ligand-binding sensor domain-containing protein
MIIVEKKNTGSPLGGGKSPSPLGEGFRVRAKKNVTKLIPYTMKKHILIAMLAMLVHLTNAENPMWVQYSSLGRNIIDCLADDDNYIWTKHLEYRWCLLRLDKTTGDTTSYHIPGLNSTGNISSIVVDNNGNKWIGTSIGLVKFDGDTWTIYNMSNSGLPNDNVYSIAIDKNGNIWFCGPAGLSKFDGTKCTTYKYVKDDGYDDYYDNDELDKDVSSIAIDNIGNVWLLTIYGLLKFDGNWTTYMYTCRPHECDLHSCSRCNTFFSGNSNSFIIDRNELKWICDQGYGIIKFDDTTWTTYNLQSSKFSSQGTAYSITEDSSGTKWAATYNGLLKIEGDKLSSYTINNSGLTYNHLYSLTLDKEGNKWIGSKNSIIKFDSITWTSYNLLNQIFPGNVRTVTIDETGTKWIGTDGGLVKYDDANWTTYNKETMGLPINDILSIAAEKNGDLWVGTNGSGVAKYDGSNWTLYNSSNSGLTDSTINAISIDNAGVKWIGTNNGLVRYDGTDWTTITPDTNNLFGNGVVALAVDKSGNKWIGIGEIISNELAKYDGANWTKYEIRNVSSIAIEESGLIWIGTGMGLVKFDGNNFTTYNQSNSGLPNNCINTVTIDGNGNKWIGMENFYIGKIVLSKFDGSDFKNLSNAFLKSGVTSIAIDASGKKWIANGILTISSLLVYDETGIDNSVEEKPIRPTNQGMLFPNPASGNFNISQGAGNVERVEIFNLLGTPVKNIQANSIKKIDINNLQSGIYLVRIKTNEGYRNEKLVVK